jgi:putative aldouronate transport system substrate-binding protein
MKAKKLLSLLVVTALSITTVLTGCKGKTDDAGKTDPETNQTETAKKEELKPYELQWYVIGGGPKKDTPAVEAKLNEYLKDKINATIKINELDWTTYRTKLPTMMTSGEAFDICYTSYWAADYNPYARKGAFYPMDELLDKYAPKTKALFSAEYLEGAKVDGKIYAIPANKDKAKNYGLVYNKKLAEEMGIDMSKVKTLDDVIPMLEEVKAKKPDITPFGYGGLGLGFWTTQMDEIAGNTVSAFIYSDKNDDKVYFKEESPEMQKAWKLSREMYTKGLIRQDSATYKDHSKDFSEGRVFCKYAQLKPGLAEESTTSNTFGQVFAQIEFDTPIYGNGEVTGSMMAISSTSKDPERAMMFLELLNTDPVVNNLVNYGVEGKHYTKVSDNIIKIADKPDYTNAGSQWIFGNQYINYIIEGENPKKWVTMDEFNKKAMPSRALGFVFNPEPVQNEIAAFESAKKKYHDALYYGIVDLDKTMPLHIKALKDAGADKIIAEVQKQYDEFRNNKK